MLKEFKPIDFRSNNIFKAIFTTIILYILQILVVGAFIVFTKNNIIAYVLGNLFLIVMVIIVERKRILNCFKTFKEDSKGKVLNIVIVTVSLIIVEFIVNFILIKVLGTLPGDTTNTINILKESNALSFISFFVNLLITLPIMEALIYFYPYSNIKNKLLAFIGYTLIFALLHMTTASSLASLLFFIPYILLSFAITYGYYKTNNILYPIIIHMLNNVLAAINLIILLR